MIRFIILLFGFMYLGAEFWFNTSLLDTLSHKFSREELEDLERFGKLISGIGLWLTFIKIMEFIYNKNNKWLMPIVVVSLIGFYVCIRVMGQVQDGIANYLSDTSTPIERKAAYAISLSMNDIIDGSIEVEGIDLNRDDFHTPVGKTYLSVLPAFAVEQPNAEKIFSKAGLVSLKNIKFREAHQQGNSSWDVYKKINLDMRNRYNKQYLPASKKYLESVSYDPEDLWDEYIDNMDSRNIDINDNHSERVRSRVIDILGKRGLNMPRDWRLNDRKTFIAQVSKSKSESNFRTFVSSRTGIKTDLPPNLSWSQFFSSDEVQEEIKSRSKFKVNDLVSLDLNKEQFFNRYIFPEMERQSSAVELKLRANPESYADGAKYEADGKDAIKRVKVPLIALGFSCLFALINMSFFVAGIMGGIKGMVVGVALFGVFAVMPMHQNNEISSSKAFTEASANLPDAYKIPLNWIVNVQPLVNKTVSNFKLPR